MVAWKASLFVVLAFLGSTALILFSNQLDNAFTEQQDYAPEIARLTAFPDDEWPIAKGKHFTDYAKVIGIDN